MATAPTDLPAAESTDQTLEAASQDAAPAAGSPRDEKGMQTPESTILTGKRLAVVFHLRRQRFAYKYPFEAGLVVE